MQTKVLSGSLYVSGEVSVKTLNKTAYAQFMQYIQSPEITTVDFGEVNTADSACVSLLLAIQRARAGNLNVQNTPPSVRDLANLYEVNEWLNP